MSLSRFSFNTDSIATEDPAHEDTITVTPNATLTADYTVRWEIILDGKLPAGSVDFRALSGKVEFTAGMSGYKTITLPIIDDVARADVKTFSVRLTQIDADDQELQIGTDQAISLTDNDMGKFAVIPFSSTGEHDTLVLGSSYTYSSSPTGVGGNDTIIITRFQTGNVTINDVNGQNIIKLDYGVQITDVNRDVFEVNDDIKVIRSIDITLDTGAKITITSPNSGAVGSKRYSFQIGDGVLTDYAGFYAAITSGGLKEGSTSVLDTPFVVAGASTASTGTSTEILFTATLADTATEDKDTPYEFTITPNVALTAGYRVRWDIILDGQLPAGFNDFTALSGVVTFANGADVGQTVTLPIIDDAARADVKTFSVRLTQIDADDKEVQIGTVRAISLTDNDMGEFAEIHLSSTGEHDTLVLGSSYTYSSSPTGVGGNDTIIITRFQTGDVTINDVNGQNIIKLDHGVQITDVNRDMFEVNDDIKVIRSIDITLDTGAKITITSPNSGAVGSKRYSFQIGDGVLTDYAGFYDAITDGGFVTDDKGALTTPYDIPFPTSDASDTSDAPPIIDGLTGAITSTPTVVGKLSLTDVSLVGEAEGVYGSIEFDLDNPNEWTWTYTLSDDVIFDVTTDVKIETFWIKVDDVTFYPIKITVNGVIGVNRAGDNGDDTLIGGSGDDILEGLEGEDKLYGGAGNDELRGGEGNYIDKLYGGEGNDELYGGGGNDELYGGEDDDTLKGRSGDDILSGGDGNDELYGGGGKDIFVLSLTNTGKDTVHDFKVNRDKIHINIDEVGNKDFIDEAGTNEDLLEALKVNANIRFDADEANPNNMLIFNTKGTTTEHDDNIAMVLLNFEQADLDALSSDNFDVII